MTDFPKTITNDQADLFMQCAIGGSINNGMKFANNKNNVTQGSQTAVTGTALWNYIYHQDKGSGENDTNYVYGRNASGNVEDFKEQERIFYNPAGTAEVSGTSTNDVYGAINGEENTIKGIVNHGLYTHWRKITLNGGGIDTISAPKQSILTTDNTTDNTEIYGTDDFTNTVELRSSLPTENNRKLGATTSALLAADLDEPSYRLDTISAVSGTFNTGYINITSAANNALGSESYHLGGMYDLLIKTDGDGPFATEFTGANAEGPKIYAEKFSSSDNNITSTVTDFSSSNKYFIPRFVVNNAPLLTSVDINLSLGQTPENGFVDSNVVSDASNVLELDAANFRTATGTGGAESETVHISPLADSNLLGAQVGAKKATNTPNTVPGEIVAFNIDTSGTGNDNSTFHGVKIPVTPPGVHLGGMGLRGIVLIARRILANKGVDVSGGEYKVYNYVNSTGTTDNTKFARLIAGVMNKIGQLNTVDTGSEDAVIDDEQNLTTAYDNSTVNFLGIPVSGTTDKRGTTMGRRAYNATAGPPDADAQSFDQYLAAIAGAFLGAGIFLSSGPDTTDGTWENFFDGVPDVTTLSTNWMNAIITTGAGQRTNMSSNLTGFTVPIAITAAHMGELVRGIYDATCEDIPQYLGSNIPNNTDVQTALKRELTLFKVDGEADAQDRLVHISVDDLEYGYSNAKPGMPFFRKGYVSNFGSELYNEPWMQPVCHSGNLGKGFGQGSGDGKQDDMLYDGGLPPPNRCESVSYDGSDITYTWDTTNTVKGATKDELVMNYDGFNQKTAKTGNNFTGYPYQLDYFSTTTEVDRTSKYGKPKYRWAYYFDADGTGTTSGGVFL